jgi:hypothetical protein
MPGCYLITATVSETEQLNWWLRGFGDQVNFIRKTAIEPIRQKIISVIQPDRRRLTPHRSYQDYRSKTKCTEKTKILSAQLSEHTRLCELLPV